MSERQGGDDASLIRPALAGLVPYEPGKPVEEVQRELGLERVVKLASNEGPYGPFPAAQEAIARAALELNRYPDGGAWRLRNALAERHGVRFEQVTVCAGADAVVGYVCQATLDPGDEVVTGWPSFPSYVLDPLKLGAVPVRVPLRRRAHRPRRAPRRDHAARRSSSSSRRRTTRPGTTNTRAELDAYFERVPPHVLTVLDQAYFEYLDEPDYPDAIAEYLDGGTARARPAHLLEDLRPRRAAGRLRRSGPRRSITAIGKVRRAFDVTSAGQEAALASLDGADGARAAPRRRTGTR